MQLVRVSLTANSNQKSLAALVLSKPGTAVLFIQHVEKPPCYVLIFGFYLYTATENHFSFFHFS